MSTPARLHEPGGLFVAPETVAQFQRQTQISQTTQIAQRIGSYRMCRMATLMRRCAIVLCVDDKIHDDALHDEYPLRELTGRIIGAFWTVYDIFQGEYLEGVYKKAMAVELAYVGIRVAREVPFELFHRGVSVGFYRADLIAESSVIIEVKVGKTLDPTARRQLRNYLKVAGLEVGLLLHFGPEPAIRRVVESSSSA